MRNAGYAKSRSRVGFAPIVVREKPASLGVITARGGVLSRNEAAGGSAAHRGIRLNQNSAIILMNCRPMLVGGNAELGSAGIQCFHVTRKLRNCFN